VGACVLKESVLNVCVYVGLSEWCGLECVGVCVCVGGECVLSLPAVFGTVCLCFQRQTDLGVRQMWGCAK
jgi:hypothetical protein